MGKVNLIPLFINTALASNIYISRLVRAHVDKPKNQAMSFIVQISLTPPLYDGARRFLEDADDIGYLYFSESGLTFEGDNATLTLPFEEVERIQNSNVGCRGLWVPRRRIQVYTRAIASYYGFEILERQSFLVSTGRHVSEEILRTLMVHTQLSA